MARPVRGGRSRVEPADASVRVRVRAVASSGAGVADLPDGRVVFVHGTVPGDDARIRVARVRPRWATAHLDRILAPGPERVAPPCPLFGRCGGCTLQHLAYEEQLRWKARFVADALERIGGIALDPPEVVPTPDRFGYRNRMSFTLRRLRSGRVVAGLHALDRPGHVIDTGDACLLPIPAVAAAWTALRSAWGPGARRLPAGGRLRLTLAAREGAVDLVVEGGEGGWDGGGLADDVAGLASVWHRPAGERDLRRVTPGSGAGGDAEAPPRGSTAPGGSDEPLPPAFTQVNAPAAEALADRVVALARGAATVVDAYCGAGVYGRRLAAAGASVVGIERDGAACARARRAAPESFRIVEGHVEDRLADALPVDLAIVNPPRTGLGEAVAGALARRGPPVLVYVSCDPATLARDVARLSARYVVEDVRCFDLFPQTAHVESVAALRAEDEGGV